MKKILLLMLVSICAIGWYCEPILRSLGVLKPVAQRSIPPQRDGFIIPGPEAEVKQQPACMTVEEYAAKAKTNPGAYYNMLYCEDQQTERTEFDKLMNFFTRLKYE